jgi:prepilin-type N-terminal cleavage/methylation domain-containing protein
MHRSKLGFTLIELLVVITIIGMLIGLLIPAVNMARERGRQTQCMNNGKQIGEAILNYETTQRKLPGVMSLTPTSATSTGIQYSWFEAILPNLERADIFNRILTTSSTGAAALNSAISPLRVNVAICPDDSYLVDPTAVRAQALLSYGVNDQFFVDYRPAPYNSVATPVGRNNGVLLPFAPAITSELKTRPNIPNSSFPRGQTMTTTQTVMLGERTFPDTSAVSGTRATQWADPNQASPNNWNSWKSTPLQFWKALAFPWPASIPPTGVPISPTVMASAHGASGTKGGTVVIVTYFDGHGAILPSDTPFPYTPYP